VELYLHSPYVFGLAVEQPLFYLTTLDNMYGSRGRSYGFGCCILHYCFNICQGAKFCILSYSVNPPLKLKVDAEWAFLFVVYVPVYHGHMTHIRSVNNCCEM
jgi:hypothetical protein